MAILNKGGQLLANATQRTVVLETEQQRAEFLASLPSGVNIEESFDIYVKETATVYAAGEPFKLRATLPGGGGPGEGGDDPVDSDGDAIGFEVWAAMSAKGEGDGSSEENALSRKNLMKKLNELADQYDFNGMWIKVHLDTGSYPPLYFDKQFYNCAGIKIVNDGANTTAIADSANTGKPAIYIANGLTVKTVGVKIQENNEGPSVYVTNSSTLIAIGARVIRETEHSDNTEGMFIADGCGAKIVFNGISAMSVGKDYLLGLFVATNNGQIELAEGDSLNLQDSLTLGDAGVAFYADKHGIIDVSKCTSDFIDPSPASRILFKVLSGASLIVSKNTLPLTSGFNTICDNQSYIVEEE